MKRRLFSPAIVLFLLAPVIGELLSGSAPPAEFFNPLGFLTLAVLYGGGANLARELMRRWDKSWPTLLMLGAAYGIIEEGLMVKSFFDPNWVDLDVLGVYGRFAGVNWVWALELTIYHAVFSIAIPVLLVGLIFPEQRRQPWIGQRAFRWLAVLFTLDGVFIFLALTPYRPPLAPYLLAVAVTCWLYRRARRLPPTIAKSDDHPPARARSFALTGFLGTGALFIISWVLPNLDAPVVITFLLLVGLPFAVRRRLVKLVGQGKGWLPWRQWALVSGALSFFIILAPLSEMDASRLDNTTGMTLVALAMAIFLIWLGRRVRRYVRSDGTSVVAVEAV